MQVLTMMRKTGALISPYSPFDHLSAPWVWSLDRFWWLYEDEEPDTRRFGSDLGSDWKADHALAMSSGMAALVLLFNGFPVGSQVVAARDLYGGSFRWFNE